MKKVTLQDIANSLDISRTTVWKVFSGHPGVSDNLRASVINKARELGYRLPDNLVLPSQDDLLPEDGTVSGVNIAVAVCRPETSLFWMTILHNVAKELATQNANLVYTYLPSTVGEDYVLPAQLTNGMIHGMIVMNVYNPRLIRLLAAANIPKVFLDTSTQIPLPELNGDLVLMENRTSISRITKYLIQQGRTKIGFIGDIQYAKSNYERYEGFSKTMAAHRLPLYPELNLTASIGADTYEEEIDAFLNALPYMPDAYVCASDHVACILIPLLQRRGFQVPGDIAVSGFDGNTEYPLANSLTTVQVFNNDIGKRLAAQILYRLRHPNVQYEVTYVGSQVIFRASTRSTQKDEQ